MRSWRAGVCVLRCVWVGRKRRTPTSGLFSWSDRSPKRADVRRPSTSVSYASTIAPTMGARATVGPTPATGRAGSPAGPSPGRDLGSLQRFAGNAAVARLAQSGRHSRRDGILDVVTSGNGRPLGSAIRERMESHLGADLSAVRVHTGPKAEASAASIDAAAYTTGDNIVLGRGLDPSAATTQHVLAHELAHVVQQRSGPVAGALTPDGLRISDPSDRFEQAADATARDAMSRSGGSAAPEPASSGGTQALPASTVVSRKLAGEPRAEYVQRYVIQNPVSAGTGEFKAQVKQATGTFKTTAGGDVDVQVNAGAQVRVSEDGKMAIEHSNLSNRQPKAFYATDGVLDRSIKALKAHKSDYTLYAEKKNAITVRDSAAKKVKLHRIMPKQLKVKATKSEKAKPSVKGLDMEIDAVCGSVAEKISGIRHRGGMASVLPTLERDLGLDNKNLNDAEYKVARWFYDRWLAGGKATATANLPNLVDQASGLQDKTMRDNIARDYMNLINTDPVRAAQIAEKLGVNTYADPHVGQVFGSMALGSMDDTGIKDFSQVGEPRRVTTQKVGASTTTRDIWNTHYGAVVAESAGNKVTLENYARKGEGEDEVFKGKTWYFQMYGPTTNPAQTWHNVWSTGPNPVLNALTVVY